MILNYTFNSDIIYVNDNPHYKLVITHIYFQKEGRAVIEKARGRHDKEIHGAKVNQKKSQTR